MHLNIRVAKTAGFCFGVQRAIDRVFEIVTDSERPIRTAGPLIHNEHVLEILRARGVLELQSDDALENECVVIRAHGVAPDVLKGFKDRGAMVCNVTCPKVAQVQGIVKKYARSGYTIIIVGDRGHAEVEGLLGYAQGSGYAVSGPEDIDRLPPAKNICIVAQTTQSIEIFAKTVEMLEKRYADCSVFNTICNATSERQLETKRLAQISDLMVVVGSPTSANTQRLFEISSELCRTITIRSVNDLTPDNIGSARNIGVTAGASTPSWVIQQIVDRIKEIGWAKSGLIFRSLYQFLRLAVQTNLLFSTGLLGIYLGSIRMLEIPYSQASALSCFWFPFLALNLKSLLDRKDTILGLSYIRNIVRDRRRVSILMIGLVTAVVYFLMSTQLVIFISV